MATDVMICEGARTPFGEFCQSLKEISAIDLGVIAAKGALRKAGAKPEQIDHVVMGNAMQTSADALYGARHVGLKAGIPIATPALTVNRICGSGLQAIVNGAQFIQLGEAQMVLAGGMENMSQAPHVVRGARWGLPLGQANMEDALWASLTDPFCGLNMALTAEKLADQYGITRQQMDEFAMRSFTAAKHAKEQCWLRTEIEPVELPARKGESRTLDSDEHIRDTSMEQLARLRPVFKKDGGVTAGNASGINDGACALVLASDAAARKNGLKVLGRLVSYGIAGVPPEIMGIGPVEAIKMALAKAKLTLNDLDIVEINEAFAAQYLACEKVLGLPREKANVNGGAIAIGHPLGASGARVTLTLLYEMRRRQVRYGCASLCIGGGQGIAAIFERVA
ncbi:MAG: acetyl-CoA C-acetyltransferase [candidate division Zixibacteria bacterium]|nr:acetyl-CoA C-acetyltransferase [candidate division Zixibacteria bacterium]